MPSPGYQNKAYNEYQKQKKEAKPKKKKKKEKLPQEHKNINKKQAPIQKKSISDYKGLNDKEFYEATAQWADMYDKKRMERYTKALAEVIIHELRFVGELRVPYIGTFSVQKYKGYEYMSKDFGGKPKKVCVPDRQLPVFVPCDSLINDVNVDYTTKEYKRRDRKGELSWRDYTRELRHELWDAEEEASKTDDTKAKKKAEELHEKFRKALDCRDVRSFEKIVDIGEEREEQLKRKQKRQERLKQKENVDE